MEWGKYIAAGKAMFRETQEALEDDGEISFVEMCEIAYETFLALGIPVNRNIGEEEFKQLLEIFGIDTPVTKGAQAVRGMVESVDIPPEMDEAVEDVLREFGFGDDDNG